MPQPKDIIDLWPSVKAFSQDLGLNQAQSGYRMWSRNSIASRHWANLVAAADRRGLKVSLADLAAAHSNEARRGHRSSSK